ncbi:hypothetical protein [Crocinitomix catalasitica]|uniref:hypothetical protein n=1 Tax=Crocinitomix catalasitica TaxID=184607 RepID=UPI00048913E7|nr:hypothetical protein [Crocinitomix catalasitica]
MFKSLCLLFLSVLTITVGYSQKERFLQFYGTPFINSFQDPNTEFIQKSSPQTLANYTKTKSGEVGLIYRRKFENNLSWGIGIGIRFDNYSVDFAVIDIYIDDDIERSEGLDAYFINLYIRKSNLRLQLAYDFTERLGVGLNLNTYFSTISTPNMNYAVRSSRGSSTLHIRGDSSWRTTNYGYSVDLRILGDNISLVPELFVNAELIKGLNLVCGVKLAFWGKNKRYFEIESEGVFHPGTTGKSRELLHESAITARDLSYFLGFTYDLQIFKRK